MRKEGIRTPDTFLTYTRFPGVPLQPLEHLSLSPPATYRVASYNFFCNATLYFTTKVVFFFESVNIY